MSVVVIKIVVIIVKVVAAIVITDVMVVVVVAVIIIVMIVVTVVMNIVMVVVTVVVTVIVAMSLLWLLTSCCHGYRLLVQLGETESNFDKFWTGHQLKLTQCLLLRRFEEDFKQVSS